MRVFGKRIISFLLMLCISITSIVPAYADTGMTEGGESKKQSSQKGNLSFLAHLMMGSNLIFRSGGQGQALCLWHP